MNTTVLGAIQTIGVAGIVLAGQYIVARFSKKAQEETVEVGAQEKATVAWQQYAEEMKKRLDSLEQKVNNQAEIIEEDRKRIGILERQSERDRELIQRLVARLRVALNRLKVLGDHVEDEDIDLTDRAQMRLDYTDTST